MGLSVLYIYVGLVGLCVGSFVNVLIWRIPRGESIIYPGSCCTSCGHALRWSEKLPLVSYVFLRGRCRHCTAPISPRYPLVEGLVVAAFVGITSVFGVTWISAVYAFLAVILITTAEIDRRHGVIPNGLVLSGVVGGLLLTALLDVTRLPTALLAAAVCGCIVLALRYGSTILFGRFGMGMGDVKLLVVIGIFLGWGALWVLYLAIMAGGLLGLLGLASGRLNRASRLPFAPFLALGTALHLFVVPPEAVLPL